MATQTRLCLPEEKLRDRCSSERPAATAERGEHVAGRTSLTVADSLTAPRGAHTVSRAR